MRPKNYSRARATILGAEFCAWDTETRGLGGITLLASYSTPEGSGVIKGTPRQIFDQLFALMVFSAAEHPKRIWLAHNLQYDLRGFLPWLLERRNLDRAEKRDARAPVKIRIQDIKILMRTEVDIFQIAIDLDDGTSVTLRDSFAFWPRSLRDLAKTWTPEFPKKDIDFDGGHIFDPDSADDCAYAERDAVILRIAFERMNEKILELFGVDIGATASSTALRAWQATLNPGVFIQSSRPGFFEERMRQAYFGGLVFLTSEATQKECISYDINSSYPAAMKLDGVPMGRSAFTRSYSKTLPGIYRVTVTAPDDLIVPIIPYRDDHGATLWPRGSFETHITSIEIDFARAHGYKIQVHDGWVWEYSSPTWFSSFVKKCEALRTQYKNQPAETLIKLMQNSVYGKFASRRDRREIVIASETADLIGCTPVDPDGLLYMRTTPGDQMMCAPHLAVWITAAARIRLLKAVYAVGPTFCIYGDTDSITIRADCPHLDRVPQSDAYGDFKIDKRWKTFRAIAPKVYAGIRADGKTPGTPAGAAKGMPRKQMTPSNFEALLAGEQIEVSKIFLDSLRVALARGLTPDSPQAARTLTRKSTDLGNSKNWQRELNGNVRPRYVGLTSDKKRRRMKA